MMEPINKGITFYCQSCKDLQKKVDRQYRWIEKLSLWLRAEIDKKEGK